MKKLTKTALLLPLSFATKQMNLKIEMEKSHDQQLEIEKFFWFFAIYQNRLFIMKLSVWFIWGNMAMK